MTLIHMDIDKDLHSAFKKHCESNNEPLTQAIPRLMKKDIGWSEYYMERKIEENRREVERLMDETKEYEKSLSIRDKERWEYLSKHFKYNKHTIRQEWWKGCKEIANDYSEGGITWDYVDKKWEELHDRNNR